MSINGGIRRARMTLSSSPKSSSGAKKNRLKGNARPDARESHRFNDEKEWGFDVLPQSDLSPKSWGSEAKS